MDKIAAQFKGVTADIQRDVYTAVIDDHEKDSGTMKARREKSHDTRMLIEFTSPDVKIDLSRWRYRQRLLLRKSKQCRWSISRRVLWISSCCSVLARRARN